MRAVLVLLVFVAVAPLEAATFDHSGWDRVLKTYVSELGEVDYAALQKDRKGLDDYVRLLGQWSPDNRRELFPNRANELAYWINAYNAFVMRGVADAYPTRSVRNLGALYGFFRRKDYTAGVIKVSLLDVEDDILRKKYNDPRIHFAIVCASISCPRLAREAYIGERLEEQLEREARRFVNERRNLTLDAAANQITLAAVYDLRDYKKDFEASGRKLLEYVRHYANEENRRAIEALKNPRVRFYDYDWSINDPGSRAKAKHPLERELAASAAKK